MVRDSDGAGARVRGVPGRVVDLSVFPGRPVRHSLALLWIPPVDLVALFRRSPVALRWGGMDTKSWRQIKRERRARRRFLRRKAREFDRPPRGIEV